MTSRNVDFDAHGLYQGCSMICRSATCCATVKSSSRSVSPPMCPTATCPRTLRACLRISRSPRRPSPAETFILPARDRRKEVLPLPAGPRTTATAPVGTSRSTSANTSPCFPDTDQPRSETAGASMSASSARVSVVLSIAMAPNRLCPLRSGARRIFLHRAGDCRLRHYLRTGMWSGRPNSKLPDGNTSNSLMDLLRESGPSTEMSGNAHRPSGEGPSGGHSGGLAEAFRPTFRGRPLGRLSRSAGRSLRECIRSADAGGVVVISKTSMSLDTRRRE